MNNQLRDGLVDSGFTVSGIPHPAITQLAARRPIEIFAFNKGEIKKIQGKYPYLSSCAIPANTYKGQTKAVPTVCLWNSIITNKNVPAKDVYDFTKAVFANLPRLIQAHKSAKNTKPGKVSVIATPLHKGAARYYKEKGTAIPPAAKPID